MSGSNHLRKEKTYTTVDATVDLEASDAVLCVLAHGGFTLGIYSRGQWELGLI